MALAYTKNNISPTSNAAFVGHGPLNHPSLAVGQQGSFTETPTGYNFSRAAKREPFSLGTGMVVPTTGRFIFDSSLYGQKGPFYKLLVLNPGNNRIFVGINTPSGSMDINKGFPIGSGESYEFGGHGADVIRSAWAITEDATGTIHAYGQYDNFGIL